MGYSVISFFISTSGLCSFEFISCGCIVIESTIPFNSLALLIVQRWLVAKYLPHEFEVIFPACPILKTIFFQRYFSLVY